MSNPTNSATGATSRRLDPDARAFVEAAAWLRHGLPPDPRAVDRLTPEWRHHFDTLQFNAAQAGPAGVDRGLDALKAIDARLAPVAEAIRRAPRPRRTSYTAAELMALDIQPPVEVVPGLLYEGLNFLGGRPKLGKSWLALQVALAVGTGGKVFGRDVTPGRVLYLALEDSEARLKTRMAAQNWPAIDTICFETIWPTLAQGGLDALAAVMEATPYRLLVVDTASRLLGGNIDQLDPGATNDAFGAIQQLALTYHAAALVLDHHRKPNAFQPDPVDDLLGSTGKAAPADTVMGLYRQRGKAEATLMLTGRDLVETDDLALKWDGLLCCWQAVGKAGDVARDTLQGEILAALTDMESASTRRLAQYLSKREPHISHELAELLNKGLVTKGEKDGREQPYLLTLAGKKALRDG